MAARKLSLLELMGGAPVQPISRHGFMLDDSAIEYTLKRSRRRRSISLTVDEDGLRVGAPWRASQARIDNLLHTHAQWIARKLAEWRARRAPPLSWQPGATLMVLGEPLTLTIAAVGEPTRSDGCRLHVGIDTQDPALLARQVMAWLRATAQAWFEQRTAHFAHELAVRMPTVRLSAARTRWGSCHSDGRIRLNWRLIQAPPALIDYVVVHEVAHLLEPNHSPRFWSRVQSVMPDYKVRRLALRRDGHRYLMA